MAKQFAFCLHCNKCDAVQQDRNTRNQTGRFVNILLAAKATQVFFLIIAYLFHYYKHEGVVKKLIRIESAWNLQVQCKSVCLVEISLLIINLHYNWKPALCRSSKVTKIRRRGHKERVLDSETICWYFLTPWWRPVRNKNPVR